MGAVLTTTKMAGVGEADVCSHFFLSGSASGLA
jgi:hypothetical protein